MRYCILTLLGCAVAGAAACGNPFALQPAGTNFVDTLVSIYALSGTAVSQPSAYSIYARSPVRTDLGQPFDFAFDIDSTGEAKLFVPGALKLGKVSGFQISALQYDSVKIAPTTGYKSDSAIVVHENSVLIAFTSTTPCISTLGIQSPYYAKLHVLAIDTTSAPNGRRIDFEILSDLNCGYRGLEEGVPHH